MDLRRAADRLLARSLRFHPGLRLARSRANVVAPHSRVLGVLRLGARSHHDQPSLRALVHHRRVAAGHELSGAWLRRRLAGRREAVRRHVRRPAHRDRGCDRARARASHGDGDPRTRRAARRRHLGDRGGMRDGARHRVRGRVALSGWALLALHVPPLYRPPARHGPGGNDLLLRRRPGQLHLSALRSRRHLPARLSRQLPARHAASLPLERARRRARRSGVRDGESRLHRTPAHARPDGVSARRHVSRRTVALPAAARRSRFARQARLVGAARGREPDLPAPELGQGRDRLSRRLARHRDHGAQARLRARLPRADRRRSGAPRALRRRVDEHRACPTGAHRHRADGALPRLRGIHASCVRGAAGAHSDRGGEARLGAPPRIPRRLARGQADGARRPDPDRHGARADRARGIPPRRAARAPGERSVARRRARRSLA